MEQKKQQKQILLKDCHFLEIKPRLCTYLCHSVSCVDDRIYHEHRRHTRLKTNILPNSESIHNQ